MEPCAPNIEVEKLAKSPVHGPVQPANEAETGDGQLLAEDVEMKESDKVEQPPPPPEGQDEQPPAVKDVSQVQAEMAGAEKQGQPHMEEFHQPDASQKSQVASGKEVDGQQLVQEIQMKEADKVEQFPPPPDTSRDTFKLLDKQREPAPEIEMKEGKGEQPPTVEGAPRVQAEISRAEEQEGHGAEPKKVVDKVKVDWHAVEAAERKRLGQMNLKGDVGLLLVGH